MLILRRKTNQVITINGNIEVMVCAIEGNIVKIGINAPRDVPVCREEAVHKERKICASVDPAAWDIYQQGRKEAALKQKH